MYNGYFFLLSASEIQSSVIVLPTAIPYFCHFGAVGCATHMHADFYEFCLISAGTYNHVYNKKEDSATTGTLLFLGPGEIHSLTGVTSNSYHFSFIIRKEYFEDFCHNHTDNADKILATPFVEKRLSGIQHAFLSQLASGLSFSVSEKKRPLANHLLSNMLFACFEEIPQSTTRDSKFYAVDLFQALNNYQLLDVNVANMYAGFPISPLALIEDFKQLTGYTIVQYRNIKRMEYAAHLLEEANYTITDIANMLNISSLGYFAKQFEKQYGMSPKQYQKQHRIKSNNKEKN